MDKLIDEILKGCEHDGSYIPVTEVKRLMQSYHESKLKEELIKFVVWYKFYSKRIIVKDPIHLYLKQRNDG